MSSYIRWHLLVSNENLKAVSFRSWRFVHSDMNYMNFKSVGETIVCDCSNESY